MKAGPETIGASNHRVFNTHPKAKPMLAFPILGADRIFCSDDPVPLPITGDAEARLPLNVADGRIFEDSPMVTPKVLK